MGKYLAHSKNALRLAAQILKNKSMKKSLNSKNESIPKAGTIIPYMDIDDAIAHYKGKYENAPDEYWREFYQKRIDNLSSEKELTIKASRSIIKAAIKGTMKDIHLCYPSLLKWREESRYFQLRTTRRPFSEYMINEFGKTVKPISVTCKDGLVRIFDIKIDAFLGYGPKRNSRPTKCVNVHFSLRDPSRKDNPISVEYGAN